MSNGSTSKDPETASGSAIYDFLLSELPAGNIKLASYLVGALREAGERYDRYIVRRDEWSDYSARTTKLKQITTFIEGAASGLRELDVLTRDDLSSRFGSKEIDEVVGSLQRLTVEVAALMGQAQTNGRPRDLVEERWILELADIFENAFHQPALVWGAGGGPIKRRAGFYRFLELNRPKKYPGHGKLHPRQVDRLLKKRHASRGSSIER